jgi:FlgD Ig-like domain
LRRIAVTVLVLTLLAGTTVAFVLTEELKLERSPITRPRLDRVFGPTCSCPQRTARLVFRLRRADTIDAVIVDADGAAVRTLASGRRYAPGRLVFRWDGRNEDGAVVPDGPYRLRLRFAQERRTIVVPNVVRVDTEPPAVELVSLAPRVLSPDGDSRRDTARVAFRLGERARPLLLVDGRQAYRARVHAARSAAFRWPGTVAGRPLPAGRYTVTLRAQDLAGNVSEPTPATAVAIRYVELAQDSLRARRGGVLRFRVLTDAEQVRWALWPRGGTARRPLLTGAASPADVAVQLPARIRPGRYVLRVGASGHGAEAAVVVRARG